MKKSIAIIGGGPAGLMAAEILSQNFVTVDLYESMPSLGRIDEAAFHASLC